ncbi:MAG TPA: lipoyl(octanoyl) transferase LipB [Thermoanaerobaculia bacterium]|jgi:lipoyl(octanoyl) transferase|nr:lipoyl(octanoyl) transferase LipB [Thermoanaerobaculia bacterium]
MKARTLHWSWLGRVPYGEAVDLQLAVRDALKSGEGPERFLLLEHPHVYTLGRNADGSDVLAGSDWLRARGVEIAECDRGGQVTYHGPGQLVGYPVVNLSPDRRDIRRYVRDLQEALIRTLAGYGIEGQPGEEAAFIGVWVGKRKIASIGVHLSRWVTTHGFALNVSTDLSYFSGIIPCGLNQVEMTSIEQLIGPTGKKTPALPDVAADCARHLAEILGREPVAEPHPDWESWLRASTSVSTP